MSHRTALQPAELRWQVDEDSLTFGSTAELDPAQGIVGQPIAMEAMRFGVECDAPGQNIYVRGVTGTGRMTLVKSLLGELNPKSRRRLDRCYVHNFSQPDRPRLITLPAGSGPRLRRDMRQLAEFVQDGFAEALEASPLKARRESIQERTRAELEEITKPLEEELQANGLALVQLKAGPVAQADIFPVFEGKPVPPEQFRQLVVSGKVSEDQYQRSAEQIKEYRKRLTEVSGKASQAYESGVRELRELLENEARSLLAHAGDTGGTGATNPCR